MTIIIGIDPGSRITGYGIILSEKRKLRYLASGCIKTFDDCLPTRLLKIYEGVCQLMKDYEPEVASIERVFMHHNPDSALKLGHARGVAMVAIASHDIPTHEYSAREIKQSTVGNGAAQKNQVMHMVKQLLSLPGDPQKDAADALATAICHSNHLSGIAAIQLRNKGR